MEKGCLIWITGISASGKSTIGREIEKELRARGERVENLDADEFRQNISPDLGYGPEARDLNTKRLAWIGKLLVRNGVHCIVAAVSPNRSYRDRARAWVDHFAEVWVTAPLEVCRQRDPKGLFAKAAQGKVNDIAGMHYPFEEPENAEAVVETDKLTVEESVAKVLGRLEDLGYIPKAERGASETDVYTRHDEEQIKSRLKALGYL